jgi:hypothetical protein
MDDYEPLPVADLAPNLNSWTGAGKISKVEPLSGKTPGLAFTLDYKKVWPKGGKDTRPIRCYVSGKEKVEKLQTWLKINTVAIVRGELTNQATVYAHLVEPWFPPAKEEVLDEDDSPMPKTSTQARR